MDEKGRVSQMGTSARDDFSKPVKQMLAERVNFHCSVCDAPTLGPQTGTADKRFFVGKAAHIKAAAKNGPRYDKYQTPAERKSIENGLWACSTCADIIDRDKDAYSVVDLLRIKADAEWVANIRAGKPPGSELSSLSNPTAIKRAVDVFCSRESARQERVDPRFKVGVRMGEHGPTYEVTAKEAVEARLVVTAKDKERKVQALREFFNYGGKLVLEGSDLRMEGSPLFRTEEVGAIRWQLSSAPRPVSMTVVLAESSMPPLYVEFVGNGSQGNKGVRLQGTAFNGMLTATLTADFSGALTEFIFNIDMQQWASKPVRRLPHFSRLQQLVELLAAPKKVHVQILCMHGGLESEFGTGLFDGHETFRSLSALFDEIAIIRRIDDFFDLNLELPADISDVVFLQCDVAWLLGLINLDASGETEIKFFAALSDQDMPLKTVLANQAPEAMTLKHRIDLEIYGSSYGPFDLEVSCPAVGIHVVGPATIEPGMTVELAMRAVDGNHWTPRLVDRPSAFLTLEQASATTGGVA
ncbi:hypothetical protein [Paraburkholderia rhynchosiae]|uniref:Uncharacterized protein n=1 Tax=Paraburkholderia rhynchosiae TaxID=487049 RepID=A0A2N7WLM9_9BURK|nr:hypothetical protein [Paraburkholderia rhynchosiae]PMS30330.1 hypothetical protein C0Z16_15390 [Paraburkholderia rhynchosiae]CAB3691370.1 hypothetical protein LMG27174_03186 [Paraburkholderia rhynchosiae]